MLMMISSGPCIEDDVGDDHNCGDNVHDCGGTWPDEMEMMMMMIMMMEAPSPPRRI